MSIQNRSIVQFVSWLTDTYLEGDTNIQSIRFGNRGVKRFYTHQAEAMDAVFNGSSIVAATPTASGKSMTYIIPVRRLDGAVSDLKSLSLFCANHVLRIMGSAEGLMAMFS